MARIRRSAGDLEYPASRDALWRVGVYIRLSREDGNDESMSVTNQKKIIGEYLENGFQGDFVVVDHYIEM